MKSVFYEDLDEIETSKLTSTVELMLWVPGMDMIHIGPITMTERQRLEARLIVADRTNDEVKTTSTMCTRYLMDALYAIEHHGDPDDMATDCHVQSYLDPAANPTLELVKKKREEKEQAADGHTPEME